MEGTTRSPIYSGFGEVLMGLSTIRSYSKEEEFIEKHFSTVDKNSKIYTMFWMSSRWLALRADLFSNLIILFVSVIAVVMKDNDAPIDENVLGLALIYAMQLTGLLQWTIRVVTETENHMTGVERLSAFGEVHYINFLLFPTPVFLLRMRFKKHMINWTLTFLSLKVASEADRKTKYDDDAKAASWPTAGAISIRNLRMRYADRNHMMFHTSLPLHRIPTYQCTIPQPNGIHTFRYRPELPYVLDGVNLEVSSGQKVITSAINLYLKFVVCRTLKLLQFFPRKVGICGRTGSGKSSLMLAMFRIVEPEEGSFIEIDGINTLALGLQKLRSNMTIIPQDPVMFCGTIRYNIDPFGQYSDEMLWESLERAQLKEEILMNFPDKLDHVLSERGENISVGQRQLLCIARALLRRSKVSCIIPCAVDTAFTPY